ncbi:IclR family transcriptional regulator C-terminal domain-containing protein [Streptomyces sp. NPDC006923]|uniref:IclR family transcriptional regulator domain-containing protein n=1 Tax=Streptomyces sp. NPDC006923 TaxID=3155355 RepID=UPI0033E3F8B7
MRRLRRENREQPPPGHRRESGDRHSDATGRTKPTVRRDLTEAHLAPLTHRTYTSAEKLTARLSTVREQGWAAVDQHVEVGRRAAAAPVVDASGQVVAALALSSGTSGESFETFVGRVVPEVLRSATEISRLLGNATV